MCCPITQSREQGAKCGSKLQVPDSKLLIMNDVLFRFENMEIWQRAADVSGPLFKLAEKLDERRCHRFGEQLRAATLSITNNVALRPVGA